MCCINKTPPSTYTPTHMHTSRNNLSKSPHSSVMCTLTHCLMPSSFHYPFPLRCCRAAGDNPAVVGREREYHIVHGHSVSLHGSFLSLRGCFVCLCVCFVCLCGWCLTPCGLFLLDLFFHSSVIRGSALTYKV